MMAAGGDEDAAYSSFTDSFSSSSSPFSSLSVSESNSTEVTSGSEGDIQAFSDEGIYGWICSLIEEGKVARFVNRCEGIYELDWQDVVWKYWHEWRTARGDSKSRKRVAFDLRTATNHLRAALLNSYKDKGAKEYPERKVMDKRNKTIKRCFRMPSTMIEKLSKKKTVSTCTTVHPRKSDSLSATHLMDPQSEETVCPSTSLPLAASIDFSPLNVDVEESDSLINYIILDEEPGLDNLTLSSGDDDVMSSSSDWTTSTYDRGSSGYESAEENLVKEMDPCEGPYQGGNMSFIFLEQSLYSRSPCPGNRCKVVFSSPKHSLTPREVQATVKNCFTIRVRVPHCPRLLGKQLAHGKLTVQVVVKTMEGCYIGDTRYTYSTGLMAQFEQCVKALDDEDMEMDITGSPDQQHVMLNYKKAGVTGPLQFNFAAMRVLVFVAVKEKAYNFLLAFLKSSVVLAVFQHSRQKLVPLLEFITEYSDRLTDSCTSILGLCKKLLLENVANHEAMQKYKSLLASSKGNAESAKIEENVGISEQEYDGGSELETNKDQEVLLNDLNELKYEEGRNTLNCRSWEMADNQLELDQRSEKEEKDTSAQSTCSFSPDDKMAKQDKQERSQASDELCKLKIVVLRKPCSPVPICRSRSSFPDPRTDVFVELQVRKNQQALADADCQDEAIEHVTVSRQHQTDHVPVGKRVTVEHVPVTKHQVTVEVKHSRTDQTARGWESKYVKRVSGKLGYWFRFYEPNCELSLMFTLYDKPHAAKSETKLNMVVLDHVTVVVETINWKGPLSREAKTEKEGDKVELALTRQVPLVTRSRSQTKLCIIMNGLHELCDNGEWAKFEEACEKLRHSSDADVQVAILLERAIVFLYHHDLEKAEQTASEALTIASRADNHQLLAGRAYYYLAHVYRREKKLGEAVRCIDLSKQNLHMMDVCLDQSFMAYEEGNVMKEFISSGTVLKTKLLLQAKGCFERCIDLCRRLDDSGSQVIPRTQSFALIKIAMLLLDCGSTSGRERCVSHTHVAEAKRFLDLFQKRGLDEITQRRKLQFLLAHSDLQYRLSNYQAAENDANQALDKAKELGFLLEVMPARNRINHIRQLLASGKMQACLEL